MPQNITQPDVVVTGDVVLQRSEFEALLKEPMLYGANLQVGDLEEVPGVVVSTQVLASDAHDIGRFVRVGDRLQFVADTSFQKESDFPEIRIVLEFEITSENSTQVGLRVANAAGGAALRWDIKDVESSWIRSISYDTVDHMFIIESSLRDAKTGGTLHFLESAFPRGRYGAAASSLVMSSPNFPATDAEASYAGLLGRLGILSGEAWTAVDSSVEPDWGNRVAKKPLVVGNHYDIADGKTIDWWVTPNVPEELLSDVAAGVEGWNRYFNDFRAGAKVMRFRGRLPEGVKLGDFRYNVVRFDAVAESPAAYESQNFDPLTGVQTNSMIYLPFAWYNIGKGDFVEGSNDIRKPVPQVLARHTACARHVELGGSVSDVALGTARSATAAGRALVRSTLLHEVGHALGMDHNFRGSSAATLARHGELDWLYSDTVMDYNTPALEDVNLFTSVDSNGQTDEPTAGSVLRYDRQFIDIVYNRGQQVLGAPEAFQVLPNCNDADADNRVMGVDPTCIRYDFFAHPLEGLRFATARLRSGEPALDATLGRFVSFTGVLASVEERGVKAIQATSVENLPAVLEAALRETHALGRQLFFSSYVSYRSALNKYAPLLGEWRALPQGLARDSEEAALAGWSVLPIFGENGSAKEELYLKYQSDVRTNLLAIVDDSFAAVRGERESLLGGRINALARVVDQLARAALARQGLTDETMALLEQMGEETVARVRALRVDVLTRVFRDLDALNWEGVVVTEEGATSIGRANLSSSVVNSLFAVLQKTALVSSEKVPPSVRLHSTQLLAKIFNRNAAWDSAVQRMRWAGDLRQIRSVVNAEWAILDRKLKEKGYLMEAERGRHETLAQIEQLLAETLKK
jgi:hypothetical protein